MRFRRAGVTLAVLLGVSMAAALLAASLAWAAPVDERAAEHDPPARPLLAGSEVYTAYLPLVARVYPPIVTLFDDFSDPASGWPQDASFICNPYDNVPITKPNKPDVVVYWTRGYNNGEYQFFVPPASAPYVWFCQPDALAPYVVNTDVYTVSTVARYTEGTYQGWKLNPWWDNAGLIFGASEDNTRLFMLCLGTQTYVEGGRTQQWAVFANTPYPYKLFDNPDKPYVFPYRGCSEDTNRVTGWSQSHINHEGANLLMAVVNGEVVKIYINGYHDSAWEYTLPGLAATSRVGLIGGDYEYTPSDIRFDHFLTAMQYN